MLYYITLYYIILYSILFYSIVFYYIISYYIICVRICICIYVFVCCQPGVDGIWSWKQPFYTYFLKREGPACSRSFPHTNMEPETGSLIDYCPLQRAPYQVHASLGVGGVQGEQSLPTSREKVVVVGPSQGLSAGVRPPGLMSTSFIGLCGNCGPFVAARMVCCYRWGCRFGALGLISQSFLSPDGLWLAILQDACAWLRTGVNLTAMNSPWNRGGVLVTGVPSGNLGATQKPETMRL